MITDKTKAGEVLNSLFNNLKEIKTEGCIVMVGENRKFCTPVLLTKNDDSTKMLYVPFTLLSELIEINTHIPVNNVY